VCVQTCVLWCTGSHSRTALPRRKLIAAAASGSGTCQWRVEEARHRLFTLYVFYIPKDWCGGGGRLPRGLSWCQGPPEALVLETDSDSESLGHLSPVCAVVANVSKRVWDSGPSPCRACQPGVPGRWEWWM
jgi:hypothetical protein